MFWFSYSDLGVKVLNLLEPLFASAQNWNSNTALVFVRIGNGSMSEWSLTLFLSVQRKGSCRTPRARDQFRKFSPSLFPIQKNVIKIQTLPSLLPFICQSWNTLGRLAVPCLCIRTAHLVGEKGPEEFAYNPQTPCIRPANCFKSKGCPSPWRGSWVKAVDLWR